MSNRERAAGAWLERQREFPTRGHSIESEMSVCVDFNREKRAKKESEAARNALEAAAIAADPAGACLLLQHPRTRPREHGVLDMAPEDEQTEEDETRREVTSTHSCVSEPSGLLLNKAAGAAQPFVA